VTTQNGIVPQAVPTTDANRAVRGRRLRPIISSAWRKRNGWCSIEPLTLGATTAYFGPENRLGVPQSALSIDMGTATNVNSLSFTNDAGAGQRKALRRTDQDQHRSRPAVAANAATGSSPPRHDARR
jgi:hypothetical protein